jgi:hypothetical protein
MKRNLNTQAFEILQSTGHGLWMVGQAGLLARSEANVFRVDIFEECGYKWRMAFRNPDLE